MQDDPHSSDAVLPPLDLPLHRPPPSSSASFTASESRPHTVHAVSPTLHRSEVDTIAQLAMAMAPSAPSAAIIPDRRLPRDDTAADLSSASQSSQPVLFHRMKSDNHLPGSLVTWPEHGQQREVPRDLWPQRRNTAWRALPNAPTGFPTSHNASSDNLPALFPRPSLVSRRSSRSYKEGFRDGFKDICGRLRRSSTAQQSEPQTISYNRHHLPGPSSSSIVPPTSPSKRNGRHGDDRPKKHVRNLLASSDRKDTPAPAVAINSIRNQGRAFTSGLLASMHGSSVHGGERARRSAASMKQQTAFPLFNEVSWSPTATDDLAKRRSRVGSLSSAADSGADLSTYGSSCKDSDGDVEMEYERHHQQQQVVNMKPRAIDFVQQLPSEISLQIFEHLDAKDLLKSEETSKSWRAMINETSVWRSAFLRTYKREVFTDPAPVQVGGAGCGLPNRPKQEWKNMYRARVELERNWRKGPKDAGKAVYLAGHTDSVYCVQFDEEKIITGSRDRTIRVWDINNFTCKKVIGGPNVKPTPGPKVLRTVDYPDFHIATASVNGTAYGDSIFHTPSQWHDASILCLQYDEEILVTGSSDCDLLVWDIKTYEPIKRLRKHSGGVLDVALDGKHIVSCSKDSRIIVWNRDTYEAKGELTGHRGPVNAVQLRGKYLASASGDGIARLWDIEQMKLIREFPQKERGLAAVEFSEDMKFVLAGGNDTITYKFEVETGLEVQQFTGHSQLVRSLWLDGANNRVVTGSYDLDLRVYDFATGEQLWRAEEWTTSWMLAAKSDYRRIVATSQDGRILVVDFGLHKGTDIRDGQPIEDVDLLRGLETTSAIRWRDPWAFDRKQQQLRAAAAALTTAAGTSGGGDDDDNGLDHNMLMMLHQQRPRESSVAANGIAPTLSFW